MTQSELNYIKECFSQIIDDIAGNPEWGDAAKAVAADLGTLERSLEEPLPTPNDYVGTQEYWDGVFRSETNRDKNLHAEFSKLHHTIIREIARFCKEHNLKDITEVNLHANGFEDSIEEGDWESGTDSSMSLIATKKDEETGWMLPDRENPFLFEI